MSEEYAFNNYDAQRLYRLLEEIADGVSEIAARLKVADEGSLERLLAGLFQSPQELRAYHYSDGQRSSREIAQLVGISHVTVVTYWRRWQERGLVEPSERYRGRFKRKYSVSQLVDMELSTERARNAEPGQVASDVR